MSLPQALSLLFEPPPPWVIQIWLWILVIVAAVFDILWRRIPNWLTLSGVVIGVGFNTFLFEKAGLWYSVAGLGLAFAVYFVLYLLRAMGAGDVKLMAAVGAAVGPLHWFGILLLTSLAGAVAGICLVVFKGRIHKTLSNIGIILMSLGRGRAPYRESEELDVSKDKGMRLPHGALIALGTLGSLTAAMIWGSR